MVIAPGVRLGRYEILAPLGSGGMGTVYQARDTRLDRMVAIKVLRPDTAHDPRRDERFRREAQVIRPSRTPTSARFTTLANRTAFTISSWRTFPAKRWSGG